MDFYENYSVIADSHVEDLSMIEIQKEEEAGLGIIIEGGKDEQHLPGFDEPFVSQIRPFSPAYGRVNVGDRIVQLNGVPLQDMTHDELLTQFQKSGNRVNLLLDTGAEMRIVSEVSRNKSVMEQAYSLRTAEYVNSLLANGSEAMEDFETALDHTQEEKSIKEEVANGGKRSYIFSGAVCVSIGVALGAVAVVVFKVARS